MTRTTGRPSNVKILRTIDRMARRMAEEWFRDPGIPERIGEKEWAYRMIRAAARRAREMGKREERNWVARQHSCGESGCDD